MVILSKFYLVGYFDDNQLGFSKEKIVGFDTVDEAFALFFAIARMPFFNNKYEKITIEEGI